MSQTPRQPRPSGADDARTRVVVAVPLDIEGQAAAAAVALGRPPDLLDVTFVHDAGALETALRHAGPEELPVAVFLYRSLPGVLDGGFASYIGRLAQAPVVLLVDPGHQLEPDLAAASKGPFPAALYAEARRIGCATVAPWPPAPGTLGPLARSLASADMGLASAAAATARTPVMGVYSPSGSGATELSINIAGLLAARGGKRALLVDGDALVPDLHLWLRLESAPTLGLDALWSADRARRQAGDIGALAAVRMGEYATRYRPDAPWAGARALVGGPGRLDVLAGFLNRNTVKDFLREVDSARDGGRVMDYLARWRALYDIVVIDLGSHETPLQERLAAACDTLLVVATPRRADLTLSVAGHQRLLKATGIAAERCCFALNRWGDLAHQHTMDEATERFGDMAHFAGAVDEDDALVAAARWDGSIPALDPGQAGIVRPFVEQVEFLTDALAPGTIPPRAPAGLAAAAARGRATAAALRRRLGALAGAPKPPSLRASGEGEARATRAAARPATLGAPDGPGDGREQRGGGDKETSGPRRRLGVIGMDSAADEEA